MYLLAMKKLQMSEKVPLYVEFLKTKQIFVIPTCFIINKTLSFMKFNKMIRNMRFNVKYFQGIFNIYLRYGLNCIQRH